MKKIMRVLSLTVALSTGCFFASPLLLAAGTSSASNVEYVMASATSNAYNAGYFDGNEYVRQNWNCYCYEAEKSRARTEMYYAQQDGNQDGVSYWQGYIDGIDNIYGPI